MPRKLKVFGATPPPIVPSEIIDALGQPRRVRQAAVYVAATSKGSALARLRSVHVFASASDLHAATGNDADALHELGVFEQEGDVVATTLSTRSGDPMVEVTDSGAYPIVAHWVREAGTFALHAVPID